MSDDIFDFGFTVVDESELEAVKKTQDTANDAEQLATTTQDRLDKLYNAVAIQFCNSRCDHHTLMPQSLMKCKGVKALGDIHPILSYPTLLMELHPFNFLFLNNFTIMQFHRNAD